MPRRMRKRFGATHAEALWRDACGRALEQTPAEALWRQRLRTRCARDAMRKHSGAMHCGRAQALRLRKRYGATPADALCVRRHAEALWRDACGRALVLRLRRRYGATTAEAL